MRTEYEPAAAKKTSHDSEIMEGEEFPRVSVLSVAFNRKKNVLELLEALARQDYPNFEIIVIDNHSNDGTTEAVQKAFPNVQVIRTPENYGNVSYNFGFERATGKYVVMIDDDGLPVTHRWISGIVGKFEANPRLGVVACEIRSKDSGEVAYDSPQFDPSSDMERGFPAAAYNGTGVGIRSEALDQTGYYPFYYFLSWCELHLCTRMIEAGWDVRYFPTLKVWHNRPSGTSNRPLTFYGLRNYLWYVWTFYPFPDWLQETLHFLGSRSKAVVGGALSFKLFFRSLVSALSGIQKVRADRSPISQQTLHYLRFIRENGSRKVDAEPKYLEPDFIRQ